MTMHFLKPDRTSRALTILLLGGLIGSLLMLIPAEHATAQGAPGAASDDCFFDPEKSAVADHEDIVREDDPYKGSADAPVTVVEFFDPNCPHCKTAHEMMADVIEAHEDEAQFVYKPMPLWEYSLPQIESLYIAAEEGKFDAMLDAQYENQQQGGLSMEQLQGIAADIGLDASDFAQRLEQPTYLDRIMEQREQAVDIGVESTPTILVNGQFVHPESRTAECMSTFIEEAAE